MSVDMYVRIGDVRTDLREVISKLSTALKVGSFDKMPASPDCFK